MKIIFACDVSTHEKNEFSGIPFYLREALEMQCDCLNCIEPPKYHPEYLNQRDVEKTRAEFINAGNYMTEKLKDIEADVVICLTASMIPYLETNKPLVLWHDSCWFALYSHLIDFDTFKKTYPLLHELDQKIFTKCQMVVFSAEWVRELALKYYPEAQNKVFTIPFGANINPDRKIDAEALIAHRKPAPCVLSFIGKDWERKGLPLALDVTTRLNAMGTPAILNVVGCAPEKPGLKRQLSSAIHYHKLSDAEAFTLRYYKSPYVNRIGFLDKNSESEYQQFEQILGASHFLIHPACFEHYGLVMAEANAYGVPILATDCYGPKTIVSPGHNGYLFARETFVEMAAACVQAHMCDYGLYTQLAHGAVSEFRNRLNWATAIQRLKALIAEKNIAAVA